MDIKTMMNKQNIMIITMQIQVAHRYEPNDP